MVKGFSRLIGNVLVLAISIVSFADATYARDLLATATDFDGDGISDVVSYEPSGNIFTIRSSSTKKFLQKEVGSSGAVAVPGDFDGDGRGDLVTYNRLSGEWSLYYLNGGQSSVIFGGPGYQPVPGRYTGNGCTDLAVFNRKTGTWKIRDCANSQSIREVNFGRGGIPVPADYDCDKKTDIAIFNRFNNNWRVILSRSNTVKSFYYGGRGDMPAPADYNADGCAEPAVYRYSDATFYVGKPKYYSGKVPKLFSKQWGLRGDRPAVYAINKDYRADFSVYRAFDSHFHSSTQSGTYTVNATFGKKVVQTTADTLTDDDDVFDQFTTYEELVVAATATEFCQRQPGEIRSNFVTRCEQLVWSMISGSGYYDDSISRQLVTDVINKLYPVDSIGANASWSSTMPEISQSRIPTPVNILHNMYQNVPGDYDRDGLSNLVLISSPYGASLDWTVIHDQVARSTFIFGSADSDIVTGDYDGDGKAEQIFVRESDTYPGKLEWISRDAYGIQSVSRWGKVGDRPVPGDFDCDGVYDQVVVRKSGSELYWHFRFSGGGTLVGKKLGRAVGSPYAADMDGDGCHEMVVAQPSSKGIAWYSKKHTSTASLTPIYWGFNTDMPLKPFDMDGDGRADYIVVRTAGNDRQFYVRFSGRSTSLAKAFTFGNIGDLPAVGYFNSNSSADLGIFRYKEGVLYTLNTKGVVNAIIAPRNAGLPLASDGTRIVNTTIGSGFDAFGCSVTYDFHDGTGGALWKPVSESNGNVVILLPSAYGSVRSVDILGSSAEYISSGRFRDYFGGRPVFSTTVRASSLASHNPITVRFRNNGLNVCYVVEDARARAD